MVVTIFLQTFKKQGGWNQPGRINCACKERVKVFGFAQFAQGTSQVLSRELFKFKST